MKRWKVVHLTSVHPAGDTRILYRECKSLAEAGFEVVLIATGLADVLPEGVRVHVVPAPTHRIQRFLATGRHVYEAAIEEAADIYHFHDPELLWVGWRLQRRGARVIYDVHEDLPRQVLSKHWIPRPLRAVVGAAAEAVELPLARTMSAVVAATPLIASRFPRERTIIVQNFPVPQDLISSVSLPYDERPPLVVYAGVIAAVRGAVEMVRATGLLPVDGRLALAGRFAPPSLEGQLRELPEWSRVDCVGWQSREDLALLFGRARVGLVTLHPTQNFVDSYPTKLFEYMAAGLPVIASDFPLWRAIVTEARCGLLVDPRSPQAIADAVEWLFRHPKEAERLGQSGQEAVRTGYQWAGEARRLVALYERLLATEVTRPAGPNP